MSAMNKMLKWIGITDEEDYDEDELMPISQVDEEEERITSPARRGKVVNLHATSQMKVVVAQIQRFEDAKDIADHLKNKKPIVINLESLDVDVSRRVVDFLSGAVYGVDGSIQRVASGIFLIAPNNVGIMGDFAEDFKKSYPFTY